MDDDPQSQITFLKNMLTEERDDRSKTEEEALKVLRGVKKKFEKQLREREQEIQNLRSCFAEERNKNTELENQRHKTVEDLRVQLQKSHQEVMKLSTCPSPRTPSARTPNPQSPTKSASKANNADFIDSLGKEIADLKMHIEDYKAQLNDKQCELKSAMEKQEITKNINIRLRDDCRKLNDEIEKLKSSLRKAHVDAEREVADRMALIENERDDLKRQLRAHDREISRYDRQEKNLKSSLEDRDQQLQAQAAEIRDLKSKCEEYRRMKAEETEREKASLLKELQDLRKDLADKSKDLQKQTSNAEILKSACTEIEKQAEAFDKLLTEKNLEYNRLQREKETLEVDRERLRLEITTIKQSLSQKQDSHSKSLSDLQHRIKQLEDCLKNETARVRSLKSQILEEQSKTEAERRRVADLHEQIQQCMSEADSAEERAARAESEIREVKEEAARHISKLFSTQATVNSLNSSLAHANFKIESLEDRIDSLLSQMEKEKADYETQMFCLSERLRQHHELENEMFAKIEKLEKSKKPLIGLSPRPKSVPRSVIPSRESKDLDIELLREKSRNDELQIKLMQIEAELRRVKEDQKMKYFNDGVAGGSSDPSAPPPPYLNTGSPSDSVDSYDNNTDVPFDEDDEEEGYNRHTVTVDVHQATSCRRPATHRLQREFSFTDSILEEIESDVSPNKSKTQCT